MDKCVHRLRSRRSVISRTAMGALIGGTLALTACGGGKGGGKGGNAGGNVGGNAAGQRRWYRRR